MKLFYKELKVIDDCEWKGYYNMYVYCLMILENIFI